jgi:predicted TIM-barrel fold metal-dependent hydrolase
MQEGKAWVKLSALYHDSNLKNDYADTLTVGKAYVKAVPQRVVWGTDWPHPSEFSAKKDMPDDAHLLDLLALQAPDEVIRQQILVTNPAELYHF